MIPVSPDSNVRVPLDRYMHDNVRMAHASVTSLSIREGVSILFVHNSHVLLDDETDNV